MDVKSHLPVLLSTTPSRNTVVAWNDLRRTHPDLEPNFRYAEFPADLSLAAADFRNADFCGACLKNVNLRCSKLSKANFTKADLRGADLTACDLTDVDLTAADLRGADLRGSDLERIRFGNVALDSRAMVRRGAQQVAPLEICDLSGVDLRGANLEGVNLAQVRLSGATLIGAALRGASLALAQLQNANLSGADLKEAILTNADLRYANLAGSNLSGANLIGASLVHAGLNGARLEGALVGWTDFTNTGLGFVSGLDRIVHLGPSVIDLDTVLTSFKGAIGSSSSTVTAGTTAVTSFMRGSGVPEEIINLIRGRSSSFAHTSCFISYSTADIGFVKQLYSDLQDEGVRCWYAPDSLGVGEDIRARIEEAIQKHSKLVVVLSESSVKSQWVKFEVETAFRQERQKPDVKLLLPARIDSAADTTNADWVKRIRDSRVMADFRDWHDRQHYRQALRSLIEAALVSR
jgi:uncharacterized protein YjbI with pentapeptide repeats